MRAEFRADSDADSDQGREERFSVLCQFPFADIEVIKEIKCVGEPDAAFRRQTDALIGSDVEFRVRIQNLGNMPLDVEITQEMLACLPLGQATLTLIPSTCSIDGPLPPGIINSFCTAFEAALGSPVGFPLDIGTLDKATACSLGINAFTFRFQARVQGSGNPCAQNIGCSNSISVRGTTAAAIIEPIVGGNGTAQTAAAGDDIQVVPVGGPVSPGGTIILPGPNGIIDTIPVAPEFIYTINPVPDDEEENGAVDDEFNIVVTDNAGVIDTAREIAQGFDDNVVNLSVPCRQIQFSKQVRVCPGGAFTDLLEIPILGPGTPLVLEYRYTVTNNGDLSEDVTILDSFLCQDVAPAGDGVDFVSDCTGNTIIPNCTVCQVGGVTVTVAPNGGTANRSCFVRFANEAALIAFLMLDDNRPQCTVFLPSPPAPPNTPDPECYRNCASATANITPGTAVCDGVPLQVDDSAIICYRRCQITVDKRVRCLDVNCNETGQNFADRITALGGACVEFEILITNTGMPNICALRLTDTLTGIPGQIELIPGSAVFTFLRTGNPPLTCPTPAGFNVTGTPYVWNPDDCSAGAGPLFQPTDQLRIRFRARVPAGALPTNAIIEPLAGNGIANSVAVGDDVQVIPVGQPVMPGAAIILPGPNGILNTVPAPDDITIPSPVNTVLVECVRDVDCPPPPTPPTIFCCGVTDTATVDVGDCKYDIVKQVKCQGAGDGTLVDLVQAFPGQTVTYRVRICNLGTVRITSLNIADLLTCVSGSGSDPCAPAANCAAAGTPCANCALVPGSVAADVRPINSGVPGFNVTPAFAAFNTNGSTQTYVLPGGGELDPGECLVLAFNVAVGASIPAGSGVDCYNRASVTVPSSGLPAAVCGNDCPTLTDCACVDVIVPDFTFDKLVSLDCGNNNSIDVVDAGAGLGGTVDLCDSFFPLRAIYRFKITNTGETALSVRACDDNLVAHANAAGITVLNCSLCNDPGCVGGGDTCSPFEVIAPGGMSIRECTLVFPTPQSFRNFAALDPDGDPDCYRNTARGEATVTPGPCGTPPVLPAKQDSLTLCLRGCDLTVNKQVRCVTPVVGSYLDTLTATPGSTVEFRITVTNTGDRPISAVEFCDNLVCANSGLSFIPASVTVAVNGLPCPSTFAPPFGVACPPGAPAVWLASSCGLGGLNPSDQLVVTFRADVVGPAPQDCTNNITVRGGINCGDVPACGGNPVFSCQATDPTPPTVQIRSCGFTFEKMVKCAGAPDGTYAPSVDSIRGGTVTFRIQVCNTGAFDIDEVCIADLLSCVSNSGSNPCAGGANCAPAGFPCSTCQFLPGTLAADIRPSGAPNPVDNVTPAFAAFLPDGQNRCYDLGALGQAINPGECLHLTFNVQTDPNFSTPNSGVDCYNRATVSIPGSGLPANVCGNNCPSITDCACVDIRIPGLVCETTIAADFNNNGSIDAGPSTNLILPAISDANFPIRFIFKFAATNTGEIQINGVVITVADLLADACAAGWTVNPACALCDGACCAGGNDHDIGPFNLAGGAMQMFTCEMTAPTLDALNNFIISDSNPNDACYQGDSNYAGTLDSTGLCQTSPPTTLIATNCGYSLCNFDKCPRFWASATLGGKGTQATAIFYDVGGDPPESNFEGDPSSDPVKPKSPPPPPVVIADDEPPAAFGPDPEDRTNVTQKGSLLYWGAIELKWDAEGQLIYDTIITVLNDHPTQNVKLKWYIINGDAPADAVYQIPGDPNSPLVERAHPGWNFFDVQMNLTHDQPTYWRASTGLPAGLPPFTALDPGTVPPNGLPIHQRPGRPDTDPTNIGGRVLRGFAVCWAVDSLGREIRWNHLQGTAIGIDLNCGDVWEYEVWAFKCLLGANGQQPDAVPGRLQLNGDEYDWAPDLLTFDFFAAGSTAFSNGQKTYVVDTDLTLWVPDLDLRYGSTGGPVCVNAVFDVWNEDEVKLTNLYRCFCCWDQEFLSRYAPAGIVNHFLLQNLGSQKGKATIDGKLDPLCPNSVDTPLLGLYVKCFRLGS